MPAVIGRHTFRVLDVYKEDLSGFREPTEDEHNNLRVYIRYKSLEDGELWIKRAKTLVCLAQFGILAIFLASKQFGVGLLCLFLDLVTLITYYCLDNWLEKIRNRVKYIDNHNYMIMDCRIAKVKSINKLNTKIGIVIKNDNGDECIDIFHINNRYGLNRHNISERCINSKK